MPREHGVSDLSDKLQNIEFLFESLQEGNIYILKTSGTPSNRSSEKLQKKRRENGQEKGEQDITDDEMDDFARPGSACELLGDRKRVGAELASDGPRRPRLKSNCG